MSASYRQGQKVIVRIVKDRSLYSSRYAEIEKYNTCTGTITKVFGIAPGPGDATYMYSVLIERDARVITLYEDEIRPYVD